MDRELTNEQLEWMDRASTYCTLDGEYVSRPKERENLFEITTKMERYVVDSNFRAYDKFDLPQNRNRAFIFGKTAIDETKNLEWLLFGREFQNGNVFILGSLVFDDGSVRLSLNRVNRNYRAPFDSEALAEASKEGKRQDPRSLEYERTFEAGTREQRRKILERLKVTDGSSLAPLLKLVTERAQMLASIQRESENCSGNYYNADRVALDCYALLLCEQGSEGDKTRREFRDSKRNHLGDMRAIRDALFMQAGILTADKACQKMAGYVGLNSREHIG